MRFFLSYCHDVRGSKSTTPTDTDWGTPSQSLNYATCYNNGWTKKNQERKHLWRREKDSHVSLSLVTNIKWLKPEYSRRRHPRLPKILQEPLVQIFNSAVSNLRSTLYLWWIYEESLLREALDHGATKLYCGLAMWCLLAKHEKKGIKILRLFHDCCLAHFSPAAWVQQSSQLTNDKLEQT